MHRTPDIEPHLLAKRIGPLLAGFIGPFALTFIGAGSIMLAATQRV